MSINIDNYIDHIATTDQVDVRGPRFAAWITTAVLLSVLTVVTKN